MHDIEKWEYIPKKNLVVFIPQDFLKHVWSFFIIMHERVNMKTPWQKSRNKNKNTFFAVFIHSIL